MALNKCKECGNQVSSSAESCPNCGAPIKKKKGRIGCLGLIILLIGLGLVGSMLGDCQKTSEKTKKGEKEAFNSKIEEHYQRLVSSYQNKDYDEVNSVLNLFKDYGQLGYKDVETISKKVTIARLEEEVRPIPASNVEANLRIYRALATLDPNNQRYQKKVAYYSKKLAEKQRAAPKTSASEIKQGDKITIVVPGTVARLCPYANCGQDQHITRIPQGTVLTVEGIMDVKSGMLPPVKWFEVTYKGKRGWLSIYNTDKAP